MVFFPLFFLFVTSLKTVCFLLTFLLFRCLPVAETIVLFVFLVHEYSVRTRGFISELVEISIEDGDIEAAGIVSLSMLTTGCRDIRLYMNAIIPDHHGIRR